MNLDFLKTIIPKKEEKDYFLALLLKPSKIGAILFEKKEGRLLILGSSEKNIEKHIDEYNDEELIQISDVVISEIEQKLPENAFVTKTIFALPHQFVENGKIKKEYLLKFKKLCESLELSPMGFIVDIEAIVYFLQKKEGMPITSIFIELTKQTVYMYVVRSGNVLEVLTSDLRDNYITTVEYLLSQVQSFDVLPTKLILLNLEGAESIQQQFLSHQWKKELPFLHVPQIVTLDKGFENEAIINGVATQMGFDVLKADKKDLDFAKETVVKDKEEVEEEQVDSTDFGFIKDEDVSKEDVKDEADLESIKSESDQTEEAANSFATVNEYSGNEDISIGKEDRKDENVLIKQSPKENVDINLQSENKKPKSYSNIAKFSNPFEQLLKKMPRFNISSMLALAPQKNFVILFIILVGILGGTLYLYYSHIVKAEVILFGEKQVFDRKADIVFSPEGEDLVHGQIKIRQIEAQIEDSSEKQTTGSKEIGEKSKGEVTIYNKTETKKTISKGTKIEGPNDLLFELASDVTIASTSAFSTNYSSSKSQVVAVKFGPEYNLPSGSNFEFADFPTSSYFAKNDGAFSGGSKKTIPVVSKKDMDALSDITVKKLSSKALDDIKSKVENDEVVIPNILSVEFSKKNYNKKEGEESKNLSLSSSITFTGGAYKKKSVEQYALSLSDEQISSSYAIDDKSTKTDVKIVNDKDNIKAVLGAHTEYVPKIDEDKIRKNITGKTVGTASQYLKKIKNISDFKVLLRSSIPFLPQILPFNSQNIRVSLNTNE